MPGTAPVGGRPPAVRLLDVAGDLAAAAAAWRLLTAAVQADDPSSMLSLYRAAMALRSSSDAFSGESLQWLHAPDGCLAFRRPGGLVCLVNLPGAAVELPGGRVLLASADVAAGSLPDDAAVWLEA